ncbi:MAG: Cypemycin methyltransferase [Fibrobacterota bacterium]
MDWFRGWFGPLYEELYAHRSGDEAMRQVEALLRHCVALEGPVLDAGCGAGRHLQALRAMGKDAFGADLSAHLLTTAVGHGPVVHCDLFHAPFADGAFGLVASFFTGFGYFQTPAQDEQFFAELTRLVRPGGWFFLDLPDPAHVRAHLVPFTESILDEHRVVHQTRFIEEGRVQKRIDVLVDGVKTEEHWEKVRLWERDALEAMGHRNGLDVVACFGDSFGTPWVEGAARQALLWRKRE